MNELLMLFFIVVVVIIVIVGIVITQSHHINAVNDVLDEYIGNDPSIPRAFREALLPLEFEKLGDVPLQYAFSYHLKPSEERRTIFVAAAKGSEVLLNGTLLKDVLNETRVKIIFVGYIEAGSDVIKLIVTSPNHKQPVMFISVASQ